MIANPCSISYLFEYANNSSYVERNDYVDAVYDELDGKVSKEAITYIFQLLLHTVGDNYIDAGCAVLSLVIIPHDGLYIDLKSGEIKIDENYEFKELLNKSIDVCNSLKQTIAEVFLPIEPD